MKTRYPSLYAVSQCSVGTLALFNLRELYDSLTSFSVILENHPHHQVVTKLMGTLNSLLAGLQRDFKGVFMLLVFQTWLCEMVQL